MNVKGENGKHNHDFPVMRSDLVTVCEETLDMINGLRIAINTHAEILGLHRKLLERFIPKDLLAAAVDEYAQQRAKDIEAERLTAQAQESPVAPNQAN